MLQRFTLSRNVRTLLVAAAFVVYLAPLRAQSLYNATVVEQLGRVSVQASGYYTPLSTGSIVKPQQVIVTGPDGYARFQVSDGSTFEVFNNARVVFRENLGNWKDLLNVWLGRVKVFIQHEPGGNHNEVSSPTAVISVRGTVFDVVVEDDDGTTLVTVDEGIVWVRNVTAAGSTAILNRGDVIRVFRGQPLQPKGQIDKGDFVRRAMKAAEDAVYQVLVQRRIGGSTIPGGGSIPASTQGDKGKGGTTSTPGSPAPPPGSPPPPPGVG